MNGLLLWLVLAFWSGFGGGFYHGYRKAHAEHVQRLWDMQRALRLHAEHGGIGDEH